MNFINKVVLITGASSGIGAASAIKFSKNGAKVVMVGRNKDKLRNVSEKCIFNKTQPLVMTEDVTNDDSLKRIVDNTIRHFGQIDVLVNNAGISGTKSILDGSAMKFFDEMIAINLRSAVCLTNLAAPHLVKSKGNIINVTSVGSDVTIMSENFSYCTSKAGLAHFTKSIALELSSKGVRVNNVSPGTTNSDFMEKMNINEKDREGFYEVLYKSTALNKLVEPDEVADVILFLASDKAKSITGSTFVIDNGMLVKGLLN